jgi:hypothetical protein
MSCGVCPANTSLDMPGRTLLAWPSIALIGFMPIGIMRHTTQAGTCLGLPESRNWMPYKAFFTIFFLRIYEQ